MNGRRMSIGDFVDSGIPANVTDEGGKWMTPVNGKCRLTSDGIARWYNALDHEIVLSDGKAVVIGVADENDQKEVCSLFNTLAGQVNDDVFSKYVVCVDDRIRKGAVKMDINSDRINNCIAALEELVGQEEQGENIMDLLMKALADELLASYQYWVCKNLARGNGRTDAIDEFDQHCKEEMEHADKLMERIKQLGGQPIFDPADWAKVGNPWTVVSTTSVCEQLDITIKAEADAIEYYNRIIGECKGRDEVTMRLCRSIMADECEHKYDLEMLKEEFCG